MGVLSFVLGLLTVIMFHETGHFMVAKAFGFKATKFFLGFGPTVWSFRRGETEYGVKALPLGGFVKIVGMNPYEDIAEHDRPRAYGSKPRWQRALLLVAGSAMHFVLVFVVLVVSVMVLGIPTGEATNQVVAVERGSPASTTELGAGDEIVAAGGERTRSWIETRRFIRDHPGDEVTFTVERAGETREISVRLGWAIYRDGELQDAAPTRDELPEARPGDNVVGFLGVAPAPAYETRTLPGSVATASGITWDFTRGSVFQIGKVFENFWNGRLFGELAGAERSPEDSAIGPVGGGRLAQEIADRGRYFELIYLLCGFTILIGIMNLLPLPPLDGGHLAVVAWESITGKPVDLRKIIPVAAAVIAFFTVYFFAVLFLDITRPVNF